MYQSEEPLDVFFKELLYSAKNAKYKIVVTLLAREADSEEMYNEIIKHWSSLHDVTGKHILFVFNTYKAKSKSQKHCNKSHSNELYGKNYTFFKNENIAFASNKNLKLMEGHIKPDNNLKKMHTRRVTSLKEIFKLKEKDIPSLLIFMLDFDTLLSPSIIVPLSDISNIYQYLKNMNEDLEDLFNQLELMIEDYSNKLFQLKNLQNELFHSNKYILKSFEYLGEVENQPIARQNVENIYEECKKVGSKKECFKYFNIVKKEVKNLNTNLIKELQSTIDKVFFLSTEDWENKQLKIKNLKISIQYIQKEKKIIWEHIFDIVKKISNNKTNLQEDISISHSTNITNNNFYAPITGIAINQGTANQNINEKGFADD